MALSINQAQDIVQKLSNEQLIQEYTRGNIPQFVVFSEMQRRQSMQNKAAQPPTETVAEKMVGKESGPEGISSLQPPPQMAAKGGITDASPITMGYSDDLPPEARKIISMRLKMMKNLEEPMEYAEGGEINSPPTGRDNPLTSREIADMLLHPVMMTESGGKQSAVSPKGAVGVMQIMPGTGPEAAKIAGVKWDPNRFKTDAEYNTKLGHAYLTSMIDRFGDTEKALAAYNWGPTNLSNALVKANKSGLDWKSYLPRETSNYLGKILGSRQALLPQRQTPEGPDAEAPMKFGGDSGFGGMYSGDSSYQYDRRSPLLDPSKMQSESSIDKGLAALRAAQVVNQMGRPPMQRKEGGAVYLEDGSVGQPVNVAEEDFPSGKFSEIPETTSEKLKRLAREKSAREAYDRQKEKERDAAYAPPEQPTGTGMETFVPPDVMRGSDVGGAIGSVGRALFPPILPKSGEEKPQAGIPSALPSTRTIPEVLTQRPEERGVSAGQPPAQASARADATATGAPSIKTTPEEAQDMSFRSVMQQVQDAIGSKVPDELKENMKKHQDTLASMKNDKIADTLFAAAKTLAGQRVGSVNYGDAVANAGLAAQEAQKRIYKADDEMRKYRSDLLKAQDENNYRAANIAMNKIIQADHDKRAMATAMMQANKSIQGEELKLKQLEEARRRDSMTALNAELSRLTAGGAIQMQMLSPEDQARVKAIRTQIDQLRSVDIKTGAPVAPSGEIPPPPAGFKVK